MRKRITLILLGGICIFCMNFRVNAQTETTLELTVRQVVVDNEIASITGPAASSNVELYDNLGEELIASGISDSNGKVAFPLDDKYPLSGKGLYFTTMKVDGVSNGIFTCQQGQTCQETLFSIDGLNPDLNDGILIVKVARSSNLDEPVEGIQVNAWPTDGFGVPIPAGSIRIGTAGNSIIYYEGVPCITNDEGYCGAYLQDYFNFNENENHNPSAVVTLKLGGVITYDGASITVPENAIGRASIAVDEKGKLDDCVFKSAPMDKLLNPSCMEKVHQTATAQATITVNPADYNVFNNAMIQASLLSKDTANLFSAHKSDQEKITAFLEEAANSTFNPATQVKLILYVNEITNDGYNAKIGDFAVRKTVEITSPENSEEMLGACKINSLGECVSIIDRSTLLAPDGLLKFHILADGYDNGILICQNNDICEQHVYTVVGLTGKKDAILLYKVVRDEKYFEPVQNIIITAGMSDITSRVPTIYEMSSDKSIKGCVTDKYGVCPVYVNDVGAVWKKDGNSEHVEIRVYITGNISNDVVLPYAKDDQLVIYQIAVNGSGTVNDCTFTSPLTYEIPRPVCAAKKKALQTAIAGYTATPTVTVTPLPSSTPTATEVPPTPTIALAPNPTPVSGIFEGKSAPLAIGGLVLLIILLGGGTWLILRARKK